MMCRAISGRPYDEDARGRGCGGGQRRRRGEAVQVDPIKPTLKPSGAKRLKLNYDEPLSSFPFKFICRRYTVAASAERGVLDGATLLRALMADLWEALIEQDPALSGAPSLAGAAAAGRACQISPTTSSDPTHVESSFV
jgi:hypothetical protein